MAALPKTVFVGWNFDSVVSSTASTNGGNGSTEISINKDPTVRAWFPSVKLGLIVYLW